MTGHVFVVHGDLLKISADAVLIPCDASGHVMAHWAPLGAHPDPASLANALVASRVSDMRQVGDQVVRWVDTGTHEYSARAEWLGDGVRVALQAISADVLGRDALHRRAMPLVAMPLFGVGVGGFDAVRGAALRAQLQAAEDTVSQADVDVVIVCFQRSDFAAVQLQRSASDWVLSDEIRRHAKSLAHEAGAGRLVLFLGAGVSASAGIPDFAGLVASLEQRAGIAPDSAAGTADLPSRISALKARVPSEKWISDNVRELVERPHYSLSHSLLASLAVREAITTNFDALYELACERPCLDAPLEVLPWERGKGQKPWLLKAHGDPARADSLVLDKPSFDTFETDRATTAGVVRAMFALSRVVLFVGYSLRDENISRLVDEAAESHRRFGVTNGGLGTIIDIESDVTDVEANPAKLGLQPFAEAPIAESARRLQIFLDHLLWAATHEESSWLLDERYAALHATDEERESATRLSKLRLPSTGNWPAVERQLSLFGKRG